METTVPALRDRHRAEVRREIHNSLLALSRDAGYASVTVEQLSARAGISPRTFFNYFPNKDAAALADAPFSLDERAVAAFSAAGTASAARVLADLDELLLAQLEHNAPDCEDLRATLELAEVNPSLFRALIAQLDRGRAALAQLVATRLPRDVDPQLAQLIAATAMTSVRVGMHAWASTTPSRDDRASSPAPHVRRAQQLMRTLREQHPADSTRGSHAHSDSADEPNRSTRPLTGKTT